MPPPEHDLTTICPAVEAWVNEVIPELEGSYDYAPSAKDSKLPDVVVELEDARTTLADRRFPYQQLQQRLLLVMELVLSIMVENTDPGPAAALLRDFANRLLEQALRDTTLGDRVFLTSQEIEADFVPQFVEYEDGTRGRQVQVRIAIAQLLEAA